MSEKEKEDDGIRLPWSIVALLAFTVLLVIIGQIEDVVDYCREKELPILRILSRSLSTVG